MVEDSGRAQGERASALWGTGNRGGEHRSSALWGTGNRGGEHRASALWGTGSRGGESRSRGRVVAVLTLLSFALALPAAASNGDKPKLGSWVTSGSGGGGTQVSQGGGADAAPAFVPASLLAKAEASPEATFRVIVEARPGNGSAAAADAVRADGGKAKLAFVTIAGVAAELTGKQILKLARHPRVASITPDSALVSTAYEDAEMWRASTTVDQLWGSLLSPAPQAPAIAIVDSGVDASKLADFGTRVVASVTICSACPEGSSGDEQGHGTMVAGVAAGADALRPGVAKNAPIVSIRTSDKDGRSSVSDVIAAADWILANKAAFDIRVANFSLTRADATSFRVDPLNHAVERLWFAGVVVVAAAGNHGSADGPVVIKAPASDPFVIAVGALDQRGTSSPSDDVTPSWSAYGFTVDGFHKPDLAAPGRYMIAPVPTLSTLATLLPERVVSTGYMWMSGTSFSAPVVAGAAAQILARNPGWTPDQVKGALMVSAKPTASTSGSAGVGEVDAAAAAAVSSPPNPNENLYAFVTVDSATGAQTFNGAAWAEHVSSNAAWSSAAWSSAAWSSAAWSSAAWSSAAWSSAAWSSNTSNEAAWSSAAWSEAAWAEAAWAE